MRCEKGETAMKRRWKRIFAGLLAVLPLTEEDMASFSAPVQELGPAE